MNKYCHERKNHKQIMNSSRTITLSKFEPKMLLKTHLTFSGIVFYYSILRLLSDNLLGEDLTIYEVSLPEPSQNIPNVLKSFGGERSWNACLTCVPSHIYSHFLELISPTQTRTKIIIKIIHDNANRHI